MCGHNVVWFDSTRKRPGLGDLKRYILLIASSEDGHGEVESQHDGKSVDLFLLLPKDV